MTSTRRIRVLMVTATLGYGGSESSFQRLANFLSKYTDVTIALMAQNYGSANYTDQQSSTAHRVVLLDEAGKSSTGFLAKVLRWWRMLMRLRSLKSENDVTISFLSGPNLLNAVTGTPQATIVSERGSKLYHTGIPRFQKYLWLRILDPITYRRAGKIVPASIGYGNEIAQIAGARQKSKIFPIEGGIDADSLIANSETPPDPDIVRFCQGPTAVYCGRLDYGKGMDLLLPAFARVNEEQPDARLLLIGDGPLGKEIRTKCRSLGLSVTTDGDPAAAVFMAGYRSEPIRHFRLCQLYLFPSLHEGLGNALIEGVASGISILAADCRWGPRSILSTPKDDLPTDWPAHEPVELTYGKLMPLPETNLAVDLWAREMATCLSRKAVPLSIEDCRPAIARFDIKETGPKWLALIEELLGCGCLCRSTVEHTRTKG